MIGRLRCANGAGAGLLMLVLLLAVQGLPAAVPPAAGYVLRGPHLLHLMVRSLGRWRTLEVSQTRTPASDASRSVDEILVFRSPDAWRCDRHPSAARDSDHLLLVTGATALAVVDGRRQPGGPGLLQRYPELLLQRPRRLLEDRLMRLGLDTSVSSLGRSEGVPVYVVGARYPDDTLPQVWLAHDSLRPLRWLAGTAANRPDGGRLEIRYADWRRQDEAWYPWRVELWDAGRLVERVTVTGVRVDAHLTDERFDAAAVRRDYPGGTEPAAGGVIDDVQQSIQQFKRKYE